MNQMTIHRSARREERTYVEKVQEAWAPVVPEWVQVLASMADARGRETVAEAIGYSGSLVSSVLNNGYRGDLEKVAAKVAGAFMGETVNCPRKGEMARDVCLDWQAKPMGSTSPDRIRMFRACRSGCTYSRIKGATNGNE